MGVAIAVLTALALLTFPFAFNMTWSQGENNADRTLTYTTNNLAWDTSAPVNADGTINLELFKASYDEKAESGDGRDIVAPGLAGAKTVAISNKSTSAIRYYATAYRTDKVPARLTPVLSGAGEETTQHYYPEGTTDSNVMFPVTQTGIVVAGAAQDVSVGWQWLYSENTYYDSVDTYLGNNSTDELTYALFVVAEEVEVAEVSFNTNGGSAVESQTVEVGTTAKAPENPTKDGYEFAGWYADEALTQAFDFSTPIQADTTLYAKWTEIPVYYTVTFNSNGGSAVESQTVKAGETATKPENPTKEGYTFVAWFTDEEMTIPYVFATPVSADVTLYARWLENVIPTPEPNDNTDDNTNNYTPSFDGFDWGFSTNTGKTSTGTSTGTSAKAKGMTIPTTGDNTQMLVVFALVVALLCVVVAATVCDHVKHRREGAGGAAHEG